MFGRSTLEMRVLILAPIGRDAALLAGTLASMDLESSIASHPDQLLTLLSEGAGTAIIVEEALTPRAIHGLETWLAAQPPWSDMPFVVLTSSGIPTRQSHLKARMIEGLGNVNLIERPVRPDTVQSSIRTALRARMRQYEIRSRQEALIQANADLEQFAHAASHDLREPLRSVGIYSELLARNYSTFLDERGNEYLNLITSGAKRMDALLSDLLVYAHASSFADDKFDPIPAARPLESALENLAGAIRESQAEITVGEMPDVKMRESHLSQIFQNLLGNAIKYRKDGNQPKIQLSAQRSAANWIFSIEDNGIGVPEPYKEAIFGIFKRLHSNSQYSGTGMGLAICQRIIERYRGRIWVESKPDQGSRFFFTIPA